VRFPNRSRSSDREGRSQITAAIMNTTDSTCRSLLGMEVAREAYSIPHLWILGASAKNFQDAQGNPKSGLSTAMTALNVIERDVKGEIPTMWQAQAFDPSVFTKIIDEHAQLMASYTGFPPSYFGQTTTANPASADAIRVGLDGVERGGRKVQQQATAPLRRVGQLMWRFAHKGEPLPADMKRLTVGWVDAATETPTATADALTKYSTAGFIPPTSDVTLRRAGFSALDRTRLAQDRALDPDQQIIDEIGKSEAAKIIRAANSLAKEAAPPALLPAPSPAKP
jgi:hypothetical protein